MEKIKLFEVENALPHGTASKLRGLDNAGNGVLVNTIDLPHPGTGYKAGYVENRKWYRIAIGNLGGVSSSGLFNFGNSYNNQFPQSLLIYAFTSAYNELSIVSKVAAAANYSQNFISKVRVLHSKESESFLDIFISARGTNYMFISAACLIGFSLQKPEEVSEDVPEGYSVKEFAL